MSAIERYIVTEPPTSGEVRTRSFEAFHTRGLLELVLLSTAEVPRPVPLKIGDIVVHSMVQTPTNVMHIGGTSENLQISSIRIHADPDDTRSAIADVVFAKDPQS